MNLFVRGMLDSRTSPTASRRSASRLLKAHPRRRHRPVDGAPRWRPRWWLHERERAALTATSTSATPPARPSTSRRSATALGGQLRQVRLQLARLQAVTPKVSVYLGGGLQRASKNLDAYESCRWAGRRRCGRTRWAKCWWTMAGWPLLNCASRPPRGDGIRVLRCRARLLSTPRARSTWSSRSLRGYGLGLNWSRPGDQRQPHRGLARHRPRPHRWRRPQPTSVLVDPEGLLKEHHHAHQAQHPAGSPMPAGWRLPCWRRSRAGGHGAKPAPMAATWCPVAPPSAIPGTWRR